MRNLTYPSQNSVFTIDDFRTDRAMHTAEYYIHVVNDENGVCNRIMSHYDLALVMKAYERFKRECKEGWHIEVTVAISASESRARLM